MVLSRVDHSRDYSAWWWKEWRLGLPRILGASNNGHGALEEFIDKDTKDLKVTMLLEVEETSLNPSLACSWNPPL